MDLDDAERWVRRAGAGAAVVSLATVYEGLWRSLRRPRGRASGHAPKAFRSAAFYLVASGVFFGSLYRLWRPLRLELPRPARAGALALGVLLYFPGLALALWGRLALGPMYGVSTAAGAQLYADHRLVERGPYALIRHPIYLGLQLVALGALLIYRTWAALLLAVGFQGLRLRAHREEEALAAEFGEQWEEYRRRVSGWVPRWPGGAERRGRRGRW